ncbi:hypothetical protein [Sulfurimonas sp.]|uniref:hypothetical protein n=1 Tax=Sulfurimonas sp. TaxID=2022749 RepID=UPI003566E980
MTEIKYSAYSTKTASVLGTGLGYGVNEMVETATSMGLQSQRRVIVAGVTSEIESEFLTDVIQDGIGAGLGYMTGQAMRAQEWALDKSFKVASTAVVGWYSKSFLKAKFKNFRKGRKATMFSKFLGDNDNKVEECRLMADFAKMDMDGTANVGNPQAEHNLYESKLKFEALEVNKEGVRSNLAKLQIDGNRDMFEMKIKTSSFFVTDKALIKQMTGAVEVTSKDIDKLNALSSSMVFEDSAGNFIGGNQAMVELLSALRINRA